MKRLEKSPEWNKYSYSQKLRCFYCRKPLKHPMFGFRAVDRMPVCRKCGRMQPWWVNPQAATEPSAPTVEANAAWQAELDRRKQTAG